MTKVAGDLVVRTRALGDGRLLVTLADVFDDGGVPRAAAVVECDGWGTGVVVALGVLPAGDATVRARLLAGVSDALRARGAGRLRVAVDLEL